MINMKTGMPARSLAGHDRGKLYIIIRAEAEYVWVADGRCHTAAKPKKKNRKHILPDSGGGGKGADGRGAADRQNHHIRN